MEDYKTRYMQYKMNDLKRFMQYQLLCRDILREVHRICEQNLIPYSLAYGSLLGAIRDYGQIPWDYDIDIWILNTDRERFIRILKAQLSSKYYFKTRYEDKTCRHYIMRIAPIGYDSEVLHLDVFWLYAAGNDNLKIRNKIRKLNTLIQWRNVDLKYILPFETNKTTKMIYSLKQNLFKLIPNCLLDKSYATISLNLKKDRFLTDGYCVLERAYFENTKLINLKDETVVRVPKDSNKVLELLYGDWSILPTLDSQIKEMETALKRLDRFCRI